MAILPKLFAAPLPLLSLVLVSLAAPARTADITVLDDHPEGCHAMLSGQIVDGDTDRLRAVVPPGQTAFDRAVIHTRLCFDSPGGSFPEGLDLAAYLRETGISTHVAAKDSCLSACALAFLGGTQFWVEDGLTRNRSRSMHVTATLGFHAPQLNVPAGQFSETVVGQAFDVAIRASAEIFGSLEDLRISREFALSFFDVSGQDFYFVDTPERARELGVTLTGTGPLPERIDRDRIRDLCTAEFPSLGPANYQDPNSGTSFVGDWIQDLPDSTRGARNWVYLSGTTAEGTLMIDACQVEWKAPHRISLRLFRDIQTDRGQWNDPQPPSARFLAEQLSRQADGFGSALPALATPIGTRLAEIADPRPGVTDARVAEGTCAPISQSYRVVGVQSFSNMRANPGFGEPVVMEVGKDRVVVPLDRSLKGVAMLSDKCVAACRPTAKGVLTAETMSAMSFCARSNDVWWKVRTASGITGWISSKFLSP